jgi:uncharacterized membrane protein YfcA
VTDANSSPAARTSVRDVALVGLAAGLLSGLFGVGGGLLIVPALVLILHFDHRLATGTSLAAILPIASASLLTYWAQDNVDWPAAALLTVGALAGALLGTKLLHVIPVRWLTVIFSILLLVTAIRLFVPVDATGRGDLGVTDDVALVATGLFAGLLAGLLGVGGGVVMVPAMVVLLGVSPVVAKGTSVAVIIPTSILGTWRNRRNRNADIHSAMILGIAGVVTAIIGGVIADRLDPTLSNVLFALLLVVVAARQLATLRTPRPPGATADSNDVDLLEP